MLKQRQFLSILLSLLLVLVPLSLPVYGEETAEAKTESIDTETLSSEEALALVEAVAAHISAYTRYENISTRELYLAAIEYLLKENPDTYHEIMTGMLRSLDEHSEYYNATDAIALTESVTGEIIGIGVTIDFAKGFPLVVSVIPDTPAERAGLQVGDILYRADGVDLSGVNSELVLSRVRGEAGSSVHLEVERNGMILSFDIIREPIVGTSVITEIYEEDNQKLMVIEVHGFIKNTAEKFAEALKEADKAGISNIIIDLRDNGGGMLDQAVQMADTLVPEGKIITTEDHKNPIFNKVYQGSAGKKSKYHILILLNEFSASATEVFSAALRENDLAKIMGTNSYGKGSIQSLVPLQTGGIIKYTVGYYLTPNGDNINEIGLKPDFFVKNQEEKMKSDHFGTFDYSQIYQEGDQGPEVLLAKKILNFFGLYQGEINESYDRDLYYAVYAFQNQAGLFPYGVLDLTTQLNLYNYMGRATKEHNTQMQKAFEYFDMTYPEDK